MELTKSEFLDLLDEVLDIMYKMAEPHADAAVRELDADISDSDRDALATSAFLQFPDHAGGR